MTVAVRVWWAATVNKLLVIQNILINNYSDTTKLDVSTGYWRCSDINCNIATMFTIKNMPSKTF